MANQKPKERTELLQVRLTPAEKTAIIYLAQSQDLTVSDYVRGTAVKNSAKKT